MDSPPRGEVFNLDELVSVSNPVRQTRDLESTEYIGTFWRFPLPCQSVGEGPQAIVGTVSSACGISFDGIETNLVGSAQAMGTFTAALNPEGILIGVLSQYPFL